MLTVTNTIHSTIEKVWDCWTNPKQIVHWNFASDDWHAPHASNDLQVGGKFSFGMAAKNASFQFNLEGEYTEVIPYQKIAYTMADGRKAIITFSTNENNVVVTESFDPENENSLEMQKKGWQAILNNFKKHVESTNE